MGLNAAPQGRLNLRAFHIMIIPEVNSPSKLGDNMFTQDPFENLDPFELIMHVSYQFIHNAVCYNFKNSAHSFYVDLKSKELFSISITLRFALTDDEGEKLISTGLSDEYKAIIISRIERIDNENDNIIEIPRLSEGEWDTLMNTVILKNKDSDDILKLESNLDNIHKSNFELETIVFTFLAGISDEKIDDDFHDIYKILVNNKINNWLKLIDDRTGKSVMQILDSLKVCKIANISMKKNKAV